MGEQAACMTAAPSRPGLFPVLLFGGAYALLRYPIGKVVGALPRIAAHRAHSVVCLLRGYFVFALERWAA